MKKECPYCREHLEAQDAFYLLCWCRDEGESELKANYGELVEFLSEFSEISDKRKEDRFRKVWKNYNYEKKEDPLFSAHEMILSREEVGELRKFLENPKKSRQRKKILPPSGFPSFESGEHNEELVRGNAMLPAVIGSKEAGEEKTEGKEYFYQKKNPQDEFDYQMDISWGEQDYMIARVRRVCHNCYNIIPDDLYVQDVIKVYLAAVASTGKTSMLYSIFLNQDTFNRENGRYITWESIQEISVDGFFKDFLERAKEYKKEPKMFDPTQVRFIPPLFLKVRYYKDGSERIVILALYDNGGELFGKDNENEKQFAEVFFQKIKGMDAILCLVSPEEKWENDSRYGLGLNSKEVGRILEESRILDREEQRKAEENPLEVEMTIGKILEEMSGRREPDQQASREILKRMENRLGGEATMRQIIKDKYLGLIVSKIDHLAQSSLFQEEERQIFFDDVSCYFTEEEKYRKSERDIKMMQMLKDELLVEYDLKKFRTCKYHFIAAFVEEQKKFHPIRVEEPLIEIVKDYFREE